MPKSKKPIEQYDHRSKERLNNPPVGLVTPETDRDTGKKTYAYDPHLDPQLVWAGKAEHTSFEVPTVSLHVHERIDPRSIIEAVRKRNGKNYEQASFFHMMGENPPLREAIEFYKHTHGWSNRLIAGDSLLVMNSLLEKEGLAGQVQMIYIDPPYGIRYGSNFQPFVNKGTFHYTDKDEDLTAEPEMIKAFRDTWELGIHSYLTYLRDRLLLAKQLLTESGSVFVQISDENVHQVRELMDEVLGNVNFVSLITFKKTTGNRSVLIDNINDYILWYCKTKDVIKFRRLFESKNRLDENSNENFYVDNEENTSFEKVTIQEAKERGILNKLFYLNRVTSQSKGGEDSNKPLEINGKIYNPGTSYWRTTKEGFLNLHKKKRLYLDGKSLQMKVFLSDFPHSRQPNLWTDILGADDLIYVVQTNTRAIQRCVIMTTDPGDLILDPTCGSGTTAYVAEQWGRRWITCDTSRVAITLAKQRLMTALYDYYELAHPEEGVSSGFKYKTVPHITLKSIANNEPPAQETLYDQPIPDRSRVRVSGPFTVEAVPAPAVKPISEIEQEIPSADESIARSGETLRQAEWRDALLRTGIRGKRGQYIMFSRVEPLAGTRWLHAEAETKPDERGADSVREAAVAFEPQRVVVSFGPEHAPLERRQVSLAIEEAQRLVPRPKIIVFAAFQFDPEAARDIDETEWPGVTLLKAKMNDDLLTKDLKKKQTSNDSFWLIGQPDVKLDKIASGKDKGKNQVEVLGFDYFNTKTGSIESGGTANIAIWMLDNDYDGRSLFPRQVFFPISGEKEGWSRLARSLKTEIDEELIEAYRGTVSLPFEVGANRRVAVKIVDDRGIESIKVIEVR